jgi:UbiD family decarboxylase
MAGLRAFLREAAGGVRVVERPIGVRHEATALQHALGRLGLFPVLWLARPRLADGSVSTFTAVTNLTASRETTARALGLSHHTRAAEEIAERCRRPLAPVVVAREEAPVKEVARDAGSLDGLPVFTQHEADAGPYLTAAHATTYDPDTGVDNTAIQRVWARTGAELPFFPYPASHNRANIMKFWERGEKAPIAFWIGHHPAVSVGAQAKLSYPESHWGEAGALAGEPVRLVPTDLHGERLLVPAEAEIVLEGHVPPHRLVPEGPFGEYTGYAGEATSSPVFVLERITQRRDAVYHDHGSGLPDALVPDNMMIEARLLGLARQVFPGVRNVHVPLSGRRFLAYVQTEELDPATAREVLRACLEYRRVKLVVLVGADVDVFDETQVLWAVATRAQMDRDALMLSGLPGSLLDPSLGPGATTTSKLGIDATWGGLSRPPTSRVPEGTWRAPGLLAALGELDR